MKRKQLSLALALTLCLSLTTPSFAAGCAEYETPNMADFCTVSRSGASLFVDQETKLYLTSMESMVGDSISVGGYNVVPPETSWTVTNTASPPSYFLVVSISPHIRIMDGYSYSLLSPFEENIHLRRDGSFVSASEIISGDALQESVRLYPGQSVTFTLADAAQYFGIDIAKDALFSLYIACDADDNPNLEGLGSAVYFYRLGDPAQADRRGDATGIGFLDIQDGDWFHDAVKWAVEQDITTGTTATTFSPYDTCTEAQILTFLWRAKGCPEPMEAVQSKAYYAKAVAWAVENGMISAEDIQSDVQSYKLCTRAMAVEYIWKAAGSPEADAASFEDVPADAAYADAVAWAVQEGVTTGTSETTFAPDTVCSRGHIVTFLYRNLAEKN